MYVFGFELALTVWKLGLLKDQAVFGTVKHFYRPCRITIIFVNFSLLHVFTIKLKRGDVPLIVKNDFWLLGCYVTEPSFWRQSRSRCFGRTLQGLGQRRQVPPTLKPTKTLLYL